MLKILFIFGCIALACWILLAVVVIIRIVRSRICQRRMRETIEKWQDVMPSPFGGIQRPVCYGERAEDEKTMEESENEESA